MSNASRRSEPLDVLGLLPYTEHPYSIRSGTASLPLHGGRVPPWNTTDPTTADYDYRPAVAALLERIRHNLARD